MSRQIAFNGRVHPDKNRKQLESFFKNYKIAVTIDQKNIQSDNVTPDYLVSTSKENGGDTEMYRYAISKGLPILNQEWLRQVVEAKQWIQPLEEHFISQGAASAATSQPVAEAAAAAQAQADAQAAAAAKAQADAQAAAAAQAQADAQAAAAAQAQADAQAAAAAKAQADAQAAAAAKAQADAQAAAAAQAQADAQAAAAAQAQADAQAAAAAKAQADAQAVAAAQAQAQAQTQAQVGGTSDTTPEFRHKIEGADDSIASFVRDAKVGADEAVAASNAAQDAYKRRDAITVFDQNGKALTAVAAVQSQRQLLDTYIKNSINVDDDVAQAASQSLSSEFARAVKAWGDADTCATKAKASEHDPHWNQPVIPDAETKRQEAINDAKAARDAANQAITKAARLRQKADALAEEAYEIQEAAKTKEGSERDAEMKRFREKTIELPDVLQDAKRAEQDAKEADNLALVRANDAGISPQDLPQREQSPWGDILASSENSIQPQKSPGLVTMPNSLVKGGVDGDIVCALPRGQLVVTVKSRFRNFKAFILPSTYYAERKAFKDNGGITLEYENVRAYDDDTFPELHQLEPVLVATQKAKTSDKNLLVILIAYRRGSDGSFLLYNISRLREIYPATQLARYLNGVRRKQGQELVCHEPKKAKKDEASIREEREWEIRNNIPRR